MTCWATCFSPFLVKHLNFLASTIEKFNDMGAIYHEIPIVDIQKVAIDTCCIPPSEASAELLAAGPEDAVVPSGSGACST